MCLRPGEEIGAETHSGVDPFYRVESGEALHDLLAAQPPGRRGARDEGGGAEKAHA